jgi:hypothetical protein
MVKRDMLARWFLSCFILNDGKVARFPFRGRRPFCVSSNEYIIVDAVGFNHMQRLLKQDLLV